MKSHSDSEDHDPSEILYPLSSFELSQSLKEHSRSTVVILRNRTTHTSFHLEQFNTEYGDWKVLPPREIRPGETVYFASNNVRMWTGTTASVVYGNTRKNISFSVRWVNPLVDGEKGKYCELHIQGDESYALSHSLTQGPHNRLDVSISCAT